MAKQSFRQWRDENGRSGYPFGDSATLENDQGDVLPPDLFLDAAVWFDGAGPWYLSSVIVSTDLCEIVFSDSDSVVVGSVSFALGSPPESGVLELLDSSDRPVGMLVSEKLRLSYFQGWSAGTHEFFQEQTELAASVCQPARTGLGVASVVASGEIYSDEVWLVGGDGVVLEVEELETHSEITVNLVGDPLFLRKECAPNRFQTPRFLRGIYFQHGARTVLVEPDARGDIQVTAGSNLVDAPTMRITPESADVLRIEMVGALLGVLR